MDELVGKRNRNVEVPPKRKGDPVCEEWRKQQVAESERMAKGESERYKAEFEPRYPHEDWSDELAVRACNYHWDWESVWSSFFGSFEATTPIPAMRYTNEPVPGHARTQETLQIFNVRIKEVKGGLQWPLHVFGIVAARDPIDHNRNIIFNRTRDNCQVLTEEDPCLLLTGPTRAVVVCDPVYFEVVLKVKGSVESEDRDLSLLTEPITNYSSILYTCLMSKDYTSKLSTLELTFGYVVDSVEATISVRIAEGSSPDGYIGEVTAHTSSLENRVVLLHSEFEKMPVGDDGMINLSRCVASVELEGELTVSVVAFQLNHDDRINVVGKDDEVFRTKKSGKSYGRLDVGFCKMDVTVAWSLLSLIHPRYP